MTPSNDEDTIDDAVNDALAKAEGDGMNAKALAAAEEQLSAQCIAAANAASNEAEGKPKEDLTELPLASLAARGIEELHEAMRQHREKKANEPAYVPPPLTTRQQERLNEELEAGRRSQERHSKAQQEQRELAARTAQPDPSEGTSTPVHRPGLMVPSPKGGHGVFSPTT